MKEESLADYVTRLEQENKTLKNSLKDFQYSDEQHLLKVIELEQENKELKEKYTHVLELAKTNADSNEYCLQELEQKYEQLRSALEEIRTYLNTLSSIDSDFTSTETYLRIQNKINGVLK